MNEQRRTNRIPVVIGAAAAAVLWGLAVTAPSAQERGVKVVKDEAKQRVDVLVDGQPFTSYIYSDTMKKPVLFPIRTAKGSFVTRGYPLEPRGVERVDHPHHIGLWFNYGDVNGTDFWNNSDAIKPEDRAKMGTIVHKAITAVRSGADKGELETDSDWVLANGTGKVVAEGAHALRVPRRRGLAEHRPHHDADRAGRARGAHRQQGRRARPARRAAARDARRRSPRSSPTRAGGPPRWRRSTTRA